MKSINNESFRIISEFTLSDWKNGTIPVPHWHWKRLYNYGKWPNGIKTEDIAISHCMHWTMWNNPKLMRREELNKVTAEQKRIFYLARDIAVNSRTYTFLKFLMTLPEFEQEDVLKNEIKSIEDKLPNRLKRKVREEEVSLDFVTPAERKWILNRKKDYNEGVREFTVRNPATDKDIEVIQYDDLFNAHVDYGYLLELKKVSNYGLKKYLNTSDEETDKKSNADKLSRASDWMDPIVKEIMQIEFPITDEKVKNVFKKAYPDYFEKYDFQNAPSNLTKGSKITKIAVCRVLAFIYEQEHNRMIKPNSIYDRYRTQPHKYW